MKILALDTAMGACSVGFFDADDAQRSMSSVMPMTRGHAEKLVPLIKDVLIKAQADFSDIDLVAVTTGPGAFTGLRIGMSTAEALALSLQIPAVGVTTLAALAAAYFSKQNNITQPVLVIIETKRTDFYGQLFSAEGEELSEPFAMPGEDIAGEYLSSPVTVIGDALARFAAEVPETARVNITPCEGFELCDPLYIARIAQGLHASGALPEQLKPVYLRGADVSQSKRVYRVIAD
ncbi:MAG: tRNA (adenosine(37)-N6)-threonylcarbamoyltransferase complex dimerization subunit type 1 TsaB [Micavibrio sp.]